MNRAARSSKSLLAPPEEAGGLSLSAPASGFLGLSSYLGYVRLRVTIRTRTAISVGEGQCRGGGGQTGFKANNENETLSIDTRCDHNAATIVNDNFSTVFTRRQNSPALSLPLSRLPQSPLPPLPHLSLPHPGAAGMSYVIGLALGGDGMSLWSYVAFRGGEYGGGASSPFPPPFPSPSEGPQPIVDASNPPLGRRAAPLPLVSR